MKKVLLIVLGVLLISTVAFAKNTQGNIAAGMVVTDGNTNTMRSTISARVKKAGLLAGVEYLYGDKENVKQEEALKLYSEYQENFTNRLFWLVGASFEYDYGSGLERRIGVNPGIGGDVLPGLTFDVGMSYVIEKYNNFVLQDDITLRARERFDYKFNEQVGLEQSVEIFPVLDNIDNYRLEAEAAIKAAIIGGLAIKTSVQDTYHSEPTEEKNIMI